MEVVAHERAQRPVRDAVAVRDAATVITVASEAPETNSCASRDFPIPAAPITTTVCTLACSTVAHRAARSAATSCARPTSGVSSCRDRGRGRTNCRQGERTVVPWLETRRVLHEACRLLVDDDLRAPRSAAGASPP